jgi:hypothetical protein
LFSSAILTASSIPNADPCGGVEADSEDGAAGAAGAWAGGCACPKADSGMPEANWRAAAPATAGRAIEARICWYKRITVLSRGLQPMASAAEGKKNRCQSLFDGRHGQTVRTPLC